MLADLLAGPLGVALAAVLAALSLPVLLAAGYLGILALSARRTSRTADVPVGQLRLDIIVPAHNEADGIGATLESLAGSEYPTGAYRVIVVADNCDDDTATVARAAGVHVLERTDAARRGKGYALAHAFDWSRADGWAHAVVVIDADTTVTPATLTALAAHLAVGEGAVQADYRVRNRDASWRTRLLDLAFTLHHTVRSLGREQRGWSCGLRGNGMAFSHETLARVPYEAFSIVEDLEYGIALGLAGIRVSYARHAEVFGDMPSGGGADARAQRARWEVGRRQLRERLGPVLWRSWRRGRLVQRKLCGDLLADLLTPPLAALAVAVVAGTGAAAVAWGGGAPLWGLLPWLLALLSVVLYVAQGVRLSASPRAALMALLGAPVFVVWKLLGRRAEAAARRGEWVRTARPTQH